MTGLSPQLNKRLRSSLIECGQFNSQQNLAALFVDQRIAAFAKSLPESTNMDSRVDFLILYLHDKYDKDKQNALFLFLHVLLDRIPEQTDCYQKIAQLIFFFEEEVGQQTPSISFSADSQPARSVNPDVSTLQNDGPAYNSTQIYELLVNRFNEEELRTLCFYIDVKFSDLAGEGLSGKARELVLFNSRRGKLQALISKIKQIRPDISL